MNDPTELQNEINKNKFINKTNNNLSDNMELLQQLNTMQTKHIKTLDQRIDVLTKTIKIQNDTINNYLKIKSNV